MLIRFRTAVLCAFLAFVLLFGLRLANLVMVGQGAVAGAFDVGSSDPFEKGRKNYASAKAQQGQPLGDTQKFEKIATLSQTSASFDDDRKRILDDIAADGAVIQLEQAQGLIGRRSLALGIGVPPAAFDAFIEKVQRVGTVTQLAIVKNDKTNEYLQLRAKRATLEKMRDALTKLQQPGNKIEENLNILTRLTDVEQQMQDLGVALGDYDAANELCTVKLTLLEAKAAPVSWSPRRLLRLAVLAFEWAVPIFMGLGFGLLTLAGALWLVPIALSKLAALARSAGPS